MLTDQDIADLREGGQRLVAVFQALKPLIRPGTNLLDIEKLAHDTMTQLGGTPSFLGYEGYPAATCLAVNSGIVHGIPKDYVLKEGDIVGVDMGLFYKGWHTDAAVTWPVGQITPEAKRLLDGTRAALLAGTDAARPGNRVQDVSRAIEGVLRSRNITIFRSLVGHGVGRQLHLPPMIPNFDSGEPGPILQSGMTIALEPITGLGQEEMTELPDGWTLETADGKLAAQFEHTLLVTSNGPEILTPLESLIDS
jgi:methionyl aminopeptidase